MTRCYIARKLEDGSIRYVYCHADGYPAYVGAILQKHYTDVAKIDALLDLGDISSLGVSIDEDDNPYDMNEDRHYKATVFYGRDEGEDDQEAQTVPSFPHFFTELERTTLYTYLFDDGEWKVHHLRIWDGTFISMDEAMEKYKASCS